MAPSSFSPPDPRTMRDWAKAFDALGRKPDADEKRKPTDVIERASAQPPTLK
jgi:hypothetical protein